MTQMKEKEREVKTGHFTETGNGAQVSRKKTHKSDEEQLRGGKSSPAPHLGAASALAAGARGEESAKTGAGMADLRRSSSIWSLPQALALRLVA